ncbi:hypothetical protein CCACVL1_28869 [Corchorus capsularis]|uniref:Pectinesterase inhibitor n=1 Tax=Corchorus capsularis TaxID=210143 RepID=A0A1R3G4W8_COCAP|nr:hypothetical protein CCACVL1_28869 [Corchorus capsularis]
MAAPKVMFIICVVLVFCMHMLAAADLPTPLKRLFVPMVRRYNCTLDGIYRMVTKDGVVSSNGCAKFLSKSHPAPPDFDLVTKNVKNIGELGVKIQSAYFRYVAALDEYVTTSAKHCSNDFAGRLRRIINGCSK